MAVVWEKITREDDEGNTVHGLRRTQTHEDGFNLDEFADTETNEVVNEFWQDEFESEIASIDEQITALQERKAKVENRKTKLTAKWQSL